MSAAAAAVKHVDGEYRRSVVHNLMTTSDMFCLAISKCPCAHYAAVHTFSKDFLKFKHLKDLYPEKKFFFDSQLEIPLDVDHEIWKERKVAATFSQMGIRPCSTVNDLMCYKLYLCCSHTKPANNVPSPPPQPVPVAAADPAQ